MQFNELKLNADLMYFGRKYTVITIDPPTVSLRRSEGDGETIRINFYELVTNPSFRPGKIMLKSIEEQDNKYRSILDAIDGNKREQVSFRFNLIKPILVLERVKQHDLKAIYEFYEFYKEYLSESQAPEDLTQEELIEKIKDKYSKEDEDGITPRGVSVRTIKRHLAKFRLAEAEMATRGEEALVSRAGEGHLYRTDNKLLEICHPKKPDWVLDTFTIRLDEKYIPILKNTIEKQYLNVKKPSKQAVFDSIELQCIKLGIEPPKWITIMKLLGRIKESVEIRLREGDRAAAKFDSVERGYSNNEAMYPLHIVQIDHTQLDMDVLDEAGYELGRPWITLGIDVWTYPCQVDSFKKTKQPSGVDIVSVPDG